MAFWIFFLIVSIIVIIIWIITGVIIYVTRRRGKDIDVLPNTPHTELDPSRISWTEGYSRGILKSLVLKPNGCFKLEFFPTDITQGDNVQRPGIQKVIIAKESLGVFSQGELSDRRQIIKTFARSKLDLPERMRNTLEGDFESIEGQKAFLLRTLGKVVPSGDEALGQIATEINRGHLDKVFINKIKSEMQVMNQIKDLEKEENKPREIK